MDGLLRAALRRLSMLSRTAARTSAEKALMSVSDCPCMLVKRSSAFASATLAAGEPAVSAHNFTPGLTTPPFWDSPADCSLQQMLYQGDSCCSSYKLRKWGRTATRQEAASPARPPEVGGIGLLRWRADVWRTDGG